MPRFLVTGGAGFIGSNLVKKLLEEGHREVRVIDNLSTGKRVNLASVQKRIDFQFGDIRDGDFVKKQLKDVETVFHLAALASVDQSVADPSTTNESNINGTLNVLLAARDNQVKRVVYASSSAVYGNSLIIPVHEEMSANPLSPYALSKYVGEMYCQLFSNSYGVETVCLRFFNVFGPNQDASSMYSAVIPRFISAIRNDETITIYGDGEQTRDFVFVENVVVANLMAASLDNVTGETFNIACGRRISINQLAKYLMDVLGRIVPISYEEPRSGEVKHSLANIDKATERLRYYPSVDILEGLRRTAYLAVTDYADL